MKKMIFAVALMATLVLAAGCSDKKETLHIYSIIHEEETKAVFFNKVNEDKKYNNYSIQYF